MLSMLLYLFVSVFYGAFAYFAFQQKSFISVLCFAVSFLLTFPVIRIILKPKEWLGYLMLFLSFAFFFAGVYTYPVHRIPLPSMSVIIDYLKGPFLGI